MLIGLFYEEPTQEYYDGNNNYNNYSSENEETNGNETEDTSDVDAGNQENQNRPQQGTSDNQNQASNLGLVQATFTRVIDGDTIEVNINGTVERVRLIGVNSPERNQAGFNEATNFIKKDRKL